jgi:hypothetical protein
MASDRDAPVNWGGSAQITDKDGNVIGTGRLEPGFNAEGRLTEFNYVGNVSAEELQVAQEELNAIVSDPAWKHRIQILPNGPSKKQLLDEQRQGIAAQIRGELVCCHIYEELQPFLVNMDPLDELTVDVDSLTELDEIAASHGLRFHALCYWGEAAAQLAETFGDPEEDE